MHTLLVIETNPALGMLYREELEEDGYEVIVAASEAAAIEALRTSSPSLIIADYEMCFRLPVDHALLTGSTASAAIPVILHTDFDYGVVKFSKILSWQFIVKSCDLEPLKAAIRHILIHCKPRPPAAAQPALPHSAGAGQL